MKSSIKVDRIYADKKNGGKIKVSAILPASGPHRHNFIYYKEVDVKPFMPTYILKLPEHTFTKRYEMVKK